MGDQATGKLNWLQTHVPEGWLVDTQWLERHGYPNNLRNKYVAHGWLNHVLRGLYRRPAARVPVPEPQELLWQHVVVSLQALLHCPYTVGGRTALELQGFAHYVSGHPREVHLYGPKKAPAWLAKLKLDTPIVLHNAERLFKSEEATALADPHSSEFAQASFLRQPIGEWGWKLTMSTPERAVLELLDEVPKRETFHQADMLMEGLRTLRPRQLRTLLLQCRNVKVKRLFLWFAERHNHAWLKALDRSGVDLGRGKRMLARGGKLDSKYNITVPENLDAGG